MVRKETLNQFRKQKMTKTQTATGRIDVQFHFAPSFYNERVKQVASLIAKEVGSFITTDGWSVANALDYMNKNGVAAGIMSVSTPGVGFLETAESITMARALNDAAAAVAREHPGRFGNFATLPMLDVSATLAEIAYCLDDLQMEGVCMMSNVGGLYLGHESFAPVFDELNRRKAVVFVHPTDPSYAGMVKMAPVAEWPFDTTRAAIDLMYSGTVKRCPEISFILAHAGGALPMVAGRVAPFSIAYAANPSPKSMDQTFVEISRFYYDLAISARPNAIGALRGVTDLQHVLFACDWPFAPDHAVQLNIAGFEALDLTTAERYAIERGNAARLFPKLVVN
jgi:predicted TIM-barrel fold metal-dependent hydrolase